MTAADEIRYCEIFDNKIAAETCFCNVRSAELFLIGERIYSIRVLREKGWWIVNGCRIAYEHLHNNILMLSRNM